MDNNWSQLSSEEKRKERFKQWLSPVNARFSSTEAGKSYQKKTQRLIDVISLKEPDRVPVMLPISNFPIYYSGSTLQKSMYDYNELRQAWLKFLREFDLDVYKSPFLVLPGRAFEFLDYRLYRWPGHGLDSNAASYQFVESEYMKADEYDALINNPSDFWMRVYLPRVFGAFESFRKVSSFTTLVEVPISYFLPFSFPDVQNTLQSLIEAGKEIARWLEVVRDCDQEAQAMGFPAMAGGATKAPFDTLGDTLRGTQGIMKDMYRQPAKLLEALEKIAVLNIETTLASSSRNQFVYLYLHKGSDGFMSPQQFATFYWPTLKKVVLALIKEGLVPVLFAEGSYDTRLEVIKELPEASVIWWFDKTDMARAKKVLGERACLAGNVPTSLLCTGSPREVKEYCHHLIEVAGNNGGFILTGGAQIDKGNPENLRAMMETAREYQL
jgi:hypothetical protein